MTLLRDTVTVNYPLDTSILLSLYPAKTSDYTVGIQEKENWTPGGQDFDIGSGKFKVLDERERGTQGERVPGTQRERPPGTQDPDIGPGFQDDGRGELDTQGRPS